MRILCVVLTCLFVSGCMESAWKKACEENTISSYRQFTAKYPKSEFSAQANEKVETFLWEQAKDKDTINSYEAYTGKYPGGKFSEKARIRIEELFWRQTQAKNTSSGYEQYLKEYAQGKYVAEAKKQIAQLAFESAKTDGSEKAYEQFLASFPQSDAAPEATLRLRQLRLQTARTAETVVGYEQFLKQYPDGADSEELRKSLPAVKKWEETRKLGELVIQMAPKASIRLTMGAFSGKGESETKLEIEPSPTLAANLAEFRQLLEGGADPSTLRIAGFKPAGQTPMMGYNLAMMSTGEPGKVVPADKGGMTLFEYCKVNKLQDACALLAAHGGDVAPKQVEEVKAILKAVSDDLKKDDFSKILALMPDDVAESMKALFACQSQLGAKIKRLIIIASDKGIKQASSMSDFKGSAQSIAEMADGGIFESDSNSVTMSLNGTAHRLIKTDNQWKLDLPTNQKTNLPMAVEMQKAYLLVIDALSEGIDKGEITDDNFKNKTDEFVAKYLKPIVEESAKKANR